jgi:uncharacterized C2H2 Zn-finger protein
MFSNFESPILPQKTPIHFKCETCDFVTSNKKDYKRHLQTIKHKSTQNQLNTPKSQLLTTNLTLENPKLTCVCGKIYKDKSGIWRHKKKCTSIKHTQLEKDNMDDEYSEDEEHTVEHSEQHSKTKFYNIPPTNNEIIEIMKAQMIDNQEFRKFMMDQHINMMEQQKQMMEMATKSTITNTNTINANSNCNNNNTFNLQFFLNEKCKGALNLSEFVDSIKVQLSDLENFAHVDYANGISKILLKNFNNLDTYSRPIHCSDLKRETIYIKENDSWTKEPDDKPTLIKAIKQVAFKNIKLINEWVKENPGCQDPRTKQNVKYNKIVMNSMSGGTVEEQHDNIEQIVKNVTKAVVIDKYMVK